MATAPEVEPAAPKAEPTAVEVTRAPPIQKTYVVWSPTGEAPPKVAHRSHRAAHFVAHRMAERHPGQRFFVMETTGKAIVHPAEERAQ